MRRFPLLHPFTLILYFISVISVSMFVMSPVMLVLSFAGSFLLSSFLQPKRIFKDLVFYLMIFAIITISNPLFTHKGATELLFINGKAITLEACFYGAASGIMIVTIIFWFKSFNIIMTSEKLMFLLNRISPSLSLILSSALRYIPRFNIQALKIQKAQTVMGMYNDNDYSSKLKGTVRIFSVMVTWSLENAIETADSMKARGYGLKERTSFSVFRFRKNDCVIITLITALFTATLALAGVGFSDFDYYPMLDSVQFTVGAVVTYITYGLLVLIPLLYEAKEALRWAYCRSKI